MNLANLVILVNLFFCESVNCAYDEFGKYVESGDSGDSCESDISGDSGESDDSC